MVGEQMKKSINNFIYYLKFALKFDKGILIGLSLQTVIDSVSPFIYILFPKFIVDALVSQDITKTFIMIATFIAAIIVDRLLKLCSQVFIQMSFNLCDIKDGYYYTKYYLKIDHQYLEDNETRNLQQNLATDMRVAFFLRHIANFITALIQLCTCIYIITTLNPIVTLIVTVVVISNFIIDKTCKKYDFDFRPANARFLRMSDYIFQSMVNFDNAKEVRINKLNRLFTNKFNEALKEYSQQKRKIITKKR